MVDTATRVKRFFKNLWRWDGTIGRGPYLLIGIIGFAIKHNIDRLIAYFLFPEPGTSAKLFDLFSYWRPFGKMVQPTMLSREEWIFAAVLILTALPFIWMGVALTLRRLRAIRWPLWFVVFFFVPFLNLVFFLLLSLVPSRSPKEDIIPSSSGRSVWLARVIPDDPVGSAALAVEHRRRVELRCDASAFRRKRRMFS